MSIIIDSLNIFLTIVGAFSIFFAIIRIVWGVTRDNIEWDADVVFSRILSSEMPNDAIDNIMYPYCFPDLQSWDTNSERYINLFVPQNKTIKKVILQEVMENTIDSNKLRYKTIQIFKDVSPLNPLALQIERRQAIPKYKIKWRSDYGRKAEYYFGDNLDTNNQFTKIEYTYDLIAYVRRIFGLK